MVRSQLITAVSGVTFALLLSSCAWPTAMDRRQLSPPRAEPLLDTRELAVPGRPEFGRVGTP